MDDVTTSAQEPGFDLGPTAARSTPGSYRVLARKYRPATFDDLIGQQAMVRTISNAFESGRIPQAWILTGVRGVGKTTTARILARALNYELPDGSVTGPRIAMPTLGVHCQAIMESRHLDVIEMDAASHNGVDDVRQINDAVRYAPVSARTKVYILDEVHMLSPQAFNALLKTLEEPPPHAKFVFATTEIRKVPVTVLSRCQRFDLRRVDTAELMRHLASIAQREGIDVEPGALALITRAAEGSVRDALSLFDQAIAHAAGAVRAEDVRQMLGLADRARIIDLFEFLMKGEIAAALNELRDQRDIGADPAVVLSDLAEFTHFVTRVKVVPAVAEDVSLGEVERTRARAFAAALSMRVLSRTWQMLLKGIAEVRDAGNALAAAEMVLVRIAYVADLPTPDEAIRALDGNAPRSAGNGAGAAATTAPKPTPTLLRPEATRVENRHPAARGSAVASATAQPAQEAAASPAIALSKFEDIITLAAEKRDLQMKTALEREVRLVRCEDGCLEIGLENGASKAIVGELSRKLSQWTGRRWMVVVSAEAGAPTLRAQSEAQQAELKTGLQAHPLVRSVLTRFPGAEITRVQRREPDLPPDVAPDSSDDSGAEPFLDNDDAFGARSETENPGEV